MALNPSIIPFNASKVNPVNQQQTDAIVPFEVDFYNDAFASGPVTSANYTLPGYGNLAPNQPGAVQGCNMYVIDPQSIQGPAITKRFLNIQFSITSYSPGVPGANESIAGFGALIIYIEATKQLIYIPLNLPNEGVSGASLAQTQVASVSACIPIDTTASGKIYFFKFNDIDTNSTGGVCQGILNATLATYHRDAYTLRDAGYSALPLIVGA